MIKAQYHFIKAAVSAGCAVLLALSLLSYHAQDASFNRASDDEIYNILGLFGSYLADFSLQLVGLASALLVVALLLWAKQYVYEQRVSYMTLRILALIPALISTAGLFACLEAPRVWRLSIGLGGIIGDLLKNNLIPVIGTYGFLGSLFFISLVSTTFVWSLRLRDVGTSLWMGMSHIALGLVHIRDTKRLLLEWWNAPRSEEEPELEDDEDDAPTPKEKVEAAKVRPSIESREVVMPKPAKRPLPLKQQALKLAPGAFRLPDMDLLVKTPIQKKTSLSSHALENNAKLLKQVLKDFGVEGVITKIRPGPVVTLYELEPSPGTKSSRVIGLADDIARSMSAVSARISVIPGRNVLGIELPNADREIVYLRELMETEEYQDKRIKLPVALGKDIGGEPVTVDLSRMPHLLVAGTTGSGKSVAVNAMILSLLYRLTPEECRFIMIDPKMLELSVYEGIPHLLAPVVTEPSKAVVALKWTVKEMEERYRAMSYLGVRNIAGYNKKIEDAVQTGERLERQVQTGFHPETGEPIYEKQALQMKKLPFIVVIVDEMADLMLTAGKDIESSIQRLAQMARAAGIHMVMATQRPSVDVITGVIKANFPTRISFQVTSRVDSRTILNEMGAEQLLGMGDMLYMAGGTRITRVHGPFVDDKEVDKVVTYLKAQGAPAYVEDITKEDETASMTGEGASGDGLYDQAVAIVIRDRKASTSYIQRQLKIGYNRAANLIEEMEKQGVVSSPNHSGKREILVN